MNDELERLARALRANRPRPPEGARERAAAEALAAFDRHAQGIRDGERRKGKAPRIGASQLRRFAMPFFRHPYPVLAGCAGLALVAGIVHLATPPSPAPPEEPRPAAMAPQPDRPATIAEAPAPPAAEETRSARVEEPAAGNEATPPQSDRRPGADAAPPTPGPSETRVATTEEAAAPETAGNETPPPRTDRPIVIARAGDTPPAPAHIETAPASPPPPRPAADVEAPTPPAAEETRADPARMRTEASPAGAKSVPLPDEPMIVADASPTPGAKRSSFARTRSVPASVLSPAAESVVLHAVEPLSSSGLDDPFPDPDRYRGRDRFERFDPNPVKAVAEAPVSTFSIDVDTASYAFVRASLNRGVLPPRDAVRIEEMVNYFPYDYAPPESADPPFAVHVSLMPTPWNDATRLMRIGIKGHAPARADAPPANLVFLIDTSGSMDAPDKLPLLVASFRLLLDALAPDDRVAIVTYAGAAGTVLEPTRAGERGRILAALERLDAGGRTAGAEGLRQAYALAGRHFVQGGINRVILATDGDFNVGIADPDALEDYVARKRESGVSLSVLGFGMGNYDDALMQRLAQNGNGNAAYIDGLAEARKVLVEEATSTLFPIAGDVKVQVEFNPAAVGEYRLIGYESRLLRREDFRNDRVDAGEIGAGHAVTALYEVTPAGSEAALVPPLRYGREVAPEGGFAGEVAFVKIRYKLPGAAASALLARPVTEGDAVGSVAAAPREARFAAAVAAFGQLLRGGRHTGAFGYDDVIALAQGARGADPFGYRAAFVSLVRLAKSAAAMAPHAE